MAKIPEISGRPTPRFGGVVNIPDIGQAEAQAGSRLGAAISGFGQILAEEKIKDDKYKVEDATTRLQQARLNLSKGEEGFTRVRAGDIDSKFNDEHMRRFESARKEIEDSLGNDEQKKMFARRAELTRLSYNEDLINHVTRERDIFNQQVYKGGITTELDLASSEYSNPNEVNRALLRTEKLTENEADRLGIKGDARKALIKENKSNIHESVIRNAVDDGNYEYAKDWYKKNQKNILGTQQGDIEKLLKASGIKEQSQQAVDKYVTDGLSHAEALAEARKLPADVRDAAVERVNIRYNEANRILDVEQKAAGEEAWTIYADTGDIDDIPISTLETMDGKERAALQATAAKAAAGVEVKTDFKTYYGLRQMASEDPAAFKKENLLKYADKLSPADRKELVKLQTDEKGLEIARTKTQVIKQGAINAGVSKAQIKQGFGDEFESYTKRVDEELKAYQATTGKEPTTKDIADITDRLSIEVIRDPTAWFMKGKRPAVNVEIEGVPSDMIDELSLAIQKAGQPVTDDNIRKLYGYMTQ